jgi:maltose alpha-D-glucosyltransferase/alpha-amylase
VLYYGDEIGMSDNVTLPDRDGLRTPMQWEEQTPTGISVEAQTGVPESLLERVRRLIAIRQRQTALQHGDIDVLAAGHPSVLAFVRHTPGQRVVVVANLSSAPADVTLDIGSFDALSTVVDLLDGTHATALLPDGLYATTLPPYGTRWLSLVPAFAGTS